MKITRSLFFSAVLFIVLFSVASASNLEFTPILKASAFLATPDKNSALYNAQNKFYTDNEIGLRLNGEYSFNGTNGIVLHLKNNIRASNNMLGKSYENSLFRYQNLSYSYKNDTTGKKQYDLYSEVDRLFLYGSTGDVTLYAGRQAITWGLGRFWQPLDIFGAFHPLTLDREYKPGIDALNLEWYSSNFSQLNLVYAFTNTEQIERNNSIALHYLRQINEKISLSLLTAGVLDNIFFGAGLESEIFDAGIRIEAIGFQWQDKWHATAIAGLEYQFDNEVILEAELLLQSAGAKNKTEMNEESFDQLVILGLQKQLSQSVLGISLQKNLFPLLNVNFVSLISTLNDSSLAASSLLQLNFVYSSSNESDLTLSIMTGVGEKLNNGEIQSEFGHIPTSVTAQFRYYF